MCATEDELVELARLGRVQFVCPQSADRYPARLFNRLAEAAPSAMLLSRRLAAAAVVDGRRRIGLVPGSDVDDRRRLLHALQATAASAASEPQREMLVASAEYLANAWLIGESLLNTHGAMATLWIGIGPLMARLFKAARGAERTLEIVAAGQDVMFGAALGATIFPQESPTYSAQAATELCASGYTGVANPSAPEVSFGDVEVVVDGLLGIDNDTGIVELARAFAADDVDHFGELAARLTKGNLDEDYLRAAVEAVNERVRRYESRSEHQAKFDTVTIAGVFGGAAASIGSVVAASAALGVTAGCLPLAAWLASRVFGPTGDAGVARWRDLGRALNTRTSLDAVLVSRMRRQVNERATTQQKKT
jgi:hypothetical protein